MIRLRRSATRALAILGVIVAVATSRAAEENVRSLLRDLFIQVPSREAVAPPFALPDLKGTTVRLADYIGRPVMLYFWTTY